MSAIGVTSRLKAMALNCLTLFLWTEIQWSRWSQKAVVSNLITFLGLSSQCHLSLYIFYQLYARTLHKQRPRLRAFLTTLVYVEPLLQLATSICYSLLPSRQGDDRYWFCLWVGELNIFFLGGPCFILWFVLRTWELASSWDMICFGCWMVLREEKEEGWFF